MQCPKCGYVMGELDTQCLRCRGNGLAVQTAPPPPPAAAAAQAVQAVREEEKECPRCGKAARASVMLCDKCGFAYQADGGRAERYQALVAEEARAAPPAVGLRQTLPPVAVWSIIAACLLAMGGAGWAMFGGLVTGQDYETSDASSPVAMVFHHKSHRMHTVTYRVTGTAAQARVAYAGPDGATVSPPAAVALPWTQNVKAKIGAALSLSAEPAGAGGTVTAEIDVDGAARKQVSAPGADGQTTAGATL